MTEKAANTSVSFQTPLSPQSALQQFDIQRRMAMAQQLMEQSKQPEGTEMVGGGNGVNQIAVPNSKLGGLAKMLGQAIGTNQYYGAQKDAAQMQGQYMQQMMERFHPSGGAAGGGQTPGIGSGGFTPDQQNVIDGFAARGDFGGASDAQTKFTIANQTPESVNARLSGVATPVDLAGAMQRQKELNTVAPQTVNNRPGVPMFNSDAVGMSAAQAGQPSPRAMAAAIPGAPPQPMPIANMQGAPVSGPQFTDNNVQYVPPAGAAGPAMGPALSAMPNPSAAQAIVNGTPFIPDTPAQAIGMGPAQGVPGSPPPGSGAPPMPPPPTPMQAPVIGGQTPQEKAVLDTQSAGDTKLNQDAATNKAEDIKVMHVMQSGLPMQLQRFQRMREDSKNASTGYGVNNDGDGWKQNALNSIGGPTATANNDLEKLSAQGVLGELGPQLAQAGIRGNKFLESIASSASALKMNAPVDSKMGLVDDLEKMYIDNFKATSSRLRDQGIAAPTDAQIDEMVKQQKGAAPSGQSNKTSPPVGTVEQGHRFKGGNPADPNSWEKAQ